MLKDEVRIYIESRDYVSFAELSNRWPEFSDGTMAITVSGCTRTYMWIGMREEACAAIKELIAERVISPWPSTLLVYCVDGRFPSLKVAKDARDYAGERWLPVTLRPRAKVEEDPAFKRAQRAKVNPARGVAPAARP